MNSKLSALMTYVIELVVIFYVLPLLIRDTGFAMIIILLVIPLLILVCAAVYGIHQGFNLLITIITIILFTPTIFIFYNSSACIYIAVYAVISFSGNGIGSVFYKKQ